MPKYDIRLIFYRNKRSIPLTRVQKYKKERWRENKYFIRYS